MRVTNRVALFAAVLTLGAAVAPAAHADWRGRGYGGPRYYHQHNNGAGVLGAIIGLGAGVAIGSALAAPPPVYYAPPPVYYVPPPPPPVYYQPPPVFYRPPPVVYQPGGYWAPMKRGW
jgi:hypothetical protein